MPRACRHCHAPLQTTFCDLGMSPLANAYVPMNHADQMEPFFPLRAFFCSSCLLVQLQDFETAENIFSDYAYFSSYSQSWVDHARRYVDGMIGRYDLGSESAVIELASNDGYLLQFFKAAGVPCLGVEPAANVAEVAVAKFGIETIVEFFGSDLGGRLADQGRKADLMIGNNVLAHVPDLNDFVRGIKLALKPRGVITMEFPHILRLMEFNQFDTIYHEHFSYLSLAAVERIFGAFGLRVFDVDELSTHGGSLRIYATHVENTGPSESDRIRSVRDDEAIARLEDPETYSGFDERIKRAKRVLLEFLLKAKDSGKSIVGYGAPAKGNTLLNYCGVRTDILDYTVDRNPAKQGCLLPGTRIPVFAPERILKTRPDYLLILPWNLQEEVIEQMAVIREWGGQFVVPIPEVRLIE